MVLLNYLPLLECFLIVKVVGLMRRACKGSRHKFVIHKNSFLTNDISNLLSKPMSNRFGLSNVAVAGLSLRSVAGGGILILDGALYLFGGQVPVELAGDDGAMSVALTERGSITGGSSRNVLFSLSMLLLCHLIVYCWVDEGCHSR